MKILVLGGRGFIGRNVVNALKKDGHEVFISSRFADERCREIRQVQMQTMRLVDDWTTLLSEVDAVVNCVGILRERSGETYEAIHQVAPAVLAQACAITGKRFIHLSALGLTKTAKSRFIRSKRFGEQDLLSSNAEVVIVRPSLLDGDGGYGAKWFRRLAQWPLQFVMRTQNGFVATLQVTDLAEAIVILLKTPTSQLKAIYELGANKAITIPEYLQLLRSDYTSREAIQLNLPVWIVRAVSYLLDVLHFTPLSFGHVELMQGRNVPESNQLQLILNRMPTPVGGMLKADTRNLSVERVEV